MNQRFLRWFQPQKCIFFKNFNRSISVEMLSVIWFMKCTLRLSLLFGPNHVALNHVANARFISYVTRDISNYGSDTMTFQLKMNVFFNGEKLSLETPSISSTGTNTHS